MLDTILLTWNFSTLLSNAKEQMRKWGSMLMMIAGVAMVIVGVFKIAQGLMSHGKSQVSWPVNIMLIVIGALFCAGSTLFGNLTREKQGIGSALETELNNLGKDGGSGTQDAPPVLVAGNGT